MKERKEILEALLKNPRDSDRSIAKKVGVSQPTITRARNRFEAEDVFKYVTVPNLNKLGYEIIAFSKIPFKGEILFDHIKECENIIMAYCGVSELIMISVHKDFTHFVDFKSNFEYEIGDSLLAPTVALVKPLTFEGLGK